MSIQNAVRTAISGAAITLVATLVSIYIVSQFLRNSIGVIAPNLAADLGLSPAEIGLLSSIFFLAFAAVQIPLGMALDRFGPRICLVVGAAITVIGAVVFACAASPGVLIFGRALLDRNAGGSAGDRSARLFNRDDRLAREFSRCSSGHVSARPVDCGRGQG